MKKTILRGFVLCFSLLLTLTATLPVFAATYKFVYSFADQNVLNSLQPYYQKSSESGTGVSETLDEHWTVDNKGVLTRINDLGGTDLGTSFAKLYLPQKFTNFEIVYDMKVPMGTRGWTGIMFGQQDRKATNFSDGDAAFMNTEMGNAFFWGQTTGGPEGTNASMVNNYKPGEWNFVKVKVYSKDNGDRRVEYYFNDALIIANDAKNARVNGYVCLFTTTGTASFRNLAVNYLDTAGNVASSDVTAPSTPTTQPTTGTTKPPVVTPPVDGKPVNSQFTYDFSDKSVQNSLKPYFQLSAQSGTGAAEAFGTHWSVDANGVLTRVGDLGASDLGATYAELYFDRELTNFEINYDVKAPAGAHGWAGIMYGKKNLSATFFSDGDGVFINTEMGNAYFWGQTVGNPEDGNTAEILNYAVADWNRVKLKVYTNQNGVRTSELYVNGVKLLTNTSNAGAVAGSVCLFTTSGEASFRNVGINYLDASGNVVRYIAATEVKITNKIASAVIGDTFNIQATVSPADASGKEFIYSSSDLSVAIVNPEGKVTFIGSGKVTLTAKSKGNDGASDSMEVTVAPAVTGIQINNKISTAKVGDKHTLSVSCIPASADIVYLFSTDDETVATVTPQGEITFLKAGTVQISVSSTEDSSIVEVMKVTVSGSGAVNNTPNSSDEAPEDDSSLGLTVALIAVSVVAAAAIVFGVVVLLKLKKNKAA